MKLKYRLGKLIMSAHDKMTSVLIFLLFVCLILAAIGMVIGVVAFVITIVGEAWRLIVDGNLLVLLVSIAGLFVIVWLILGFLIDLSPDLFRNNKD